MQEHQEILNEEVDRLLDRRALLWRNRLFVLALVLSVCACLAALWLSGILLSAPDQPWLAAFLPFVATHRWLVLLVPAACLLVCYSKLRSLTGEIMAVPARYLDERQQMLRDQAHRAAFKIIKLACVLILAGLLVPHLPWFNPPAVSSTPNAGISLSFSVVQVDMQASSLSKLVTPGHHPLMWIQTLTPMDTFVSPPITTADIVLAGGLLLLCLWLLISALPMCVLAWQGKR